MAAKESKELAKPEASKNLSPFAEMERMFEVFHKSPFSLFGPSWWPGTRFPEMDDITATVDIFEQDGDVVLKAEVPGMKKEDIEVNLSENTITISGKKERQEKVEKKDYYRLERSYGSFKRSFHLPSGVQSDRAKANFKDGVLEVRIPKTEEARKKEKKVSID